jgi:hypothetical protein
VTIRWRLRAKGVGRLLAAPKVAESFFRLKAEATSRVPSPESAVYGREAMRSERDSANPEPRIPSPPPTPRSGYGAASP